jgi:hypothetical protein
MQRTRPNKSRSGQHQTVTGREELQDPWMQYISQEGVLWSATSLSMLQASLPRFLANRSNPIYMCAQIKEASINFSCNNTCMCKYINTKMPGLSVLYKKNWFVLIIDFEFNYTRKHNGGSRNVHFLQLEIFTSYSINWFLVIIYQPRKTIYMWNIKDNF